MAKNNKSYLFVLFSPELVNEQIALLDSIYENPAYLEDHEDPLQQFNALEDTIAVRYIIIRRNNLLIFCVCVFVGSGCI